MTDMHTHVGHKALIRDLIHMQERELHLVGGRSVGPLRVRSTRARSSASLEGDLEAISRERGRSSVASLNISPPPQGASAAAGPPHA